MVAFGASVVASTVRSVAQWRRALVGIAMVVAVAVAGSVDIAMVVVVAVAGPVGIAMVIVVAVVWPWRNIVVRATAVRHMASLMLKLVVVVETATIEVAVVSMGT